MLKSFYGKNVTIIASNGNVYFGFVDDYFFPEDNEDNEESIVLKTSSSEFIEFSAEDIESISISE